MAAATPFFLFLASFQVAIAVVVARRRLPGALAQAILLGINALLVAFDGLALEGVGVLSFLPSALDAATPYLLGAYLASTSRSLVARRLIPVLGAAAVVHVLVVARFPVAFGTPEDLLSRAWPYYASMGTLLWVAARRGGSDAYVAVAFLARPFHFMAAHVFDPTQFTWTLGDVQLWNYVGYVLLFLVACDAGLRLLRLGGIVASATAGVVAAGVATGVANAFAGGDVFASFLNYVTLALVRPAFLCVALAPDALARATAASTGAAASGAIGGLVATFAFSGGYVGGALAGLGIGVTVWAAIRAGQGRPSSGSGLPTWQVLLAALRGSSAFDGNGAGRYEWSADGLARATGVSRPRISEFAGRANAGPEALVRVHRGQVAGVRGVRTFYTLTPAGERAAAEIDGQNEPFSPRIHARERYP